MSFAFLGNIGSVELIIILIVALMIFGNKLPEVVRSASRSIGQFKRGMEEASNQVRREMEQAAAEADPTPEIKEAVTDALADDSYKPDDYTSIDHPPGYEYDGVSATASTEAPAEAVPGAETAGSVSVASVEASSPSAAQAVAERRAEDMETAPADGPTPEPVAPSAVMTPERPAETASSAPANGAATAAETLPPSTPQDASEASSAPAPEAAETKPPPPADGAELPKK